jgi:hypothetical protein
MIYALSAIFLLLVVALWQFGRQWKKAYAEGAAEIDRKYEIEQNTVEVASWFGKTGLEEADERELPRYLRREFGEVAADEGALQAADLTYLGVQADEHGSAHFWSIPGRHDGPAYAYVEINENGNAMYFGWGDREPPRKTAV